MSRRAHCLVLPYPGQGHINPMLQFSKLLAHQGVRITFVTTRSYYNSLQRVPSIAVETISDGFDNGGIEEAGSYKVYFDRFWQVGPETFAELLQKLVDSKEHVDCVIYDAFIPWALDVAKGFGIVGASYLTQNMAVNNWTTKIWPKIKTIGPNIPTFYLDNRSEDDQDYEVTKFESEECMEWLDYKPKGSVIYVSFGSMATFVEEQMEEFASCLRECSNYYLWVVRASEENKLPKDFEKKTEKGLVVTWCSQLKVLAHGAVGCFVTHCGWNSTLETLCLGVPTIAIPWWSDQSTNAKLITDVWKTGIRAPVDEKKIVRREALKYCIKEIMDEGKEMKINATQWRNLATKAVNKCGTSYENITEFANNLLN
uniref:UDP-glucosyltransferase At1g05670 family n=1 Tax=Cajanus cajan TaxID=3821 RepID=A0A151RFM8_CAJCA|nr:putative UDP-glucosyltransferase At1g05670 family [Cajanus cajan]